MILLINIIIPPPEIMQQSMETIKSKTQFDLHEFFPYLVRVFYRSVSDSVFQIYGSKFDLTVSEWRVMVVLKPNRIMSAGEIVEHSSMSNVDVSRAIGGLKKSGLLKRDINGEDKRRAALRLTSSGVTVFNALVPLVKELESELLNGISQNEVISFISTMAKIRTNAERFIQLNDGHSN